MPESTDTGTSTQDGNTTSDTTSGAGDKPITMTSAQLNERLTREREKFADYDDLKAKAAQFDELDAANKSELEKANDRAAKAEADLATLPAKAAETLKSALVELGVVAKEDEVLLTASDPDALLGQVKRLSERSSSAKTKNNVVPKEGAATTPSAGDGRRDFLRSLSQ